MSNTVLGRQRPHEKYVGCRGRCRDRDVKRKKRTVSGRPKGPARNPSSTLQSRHRSSGVAVWDNTATSYNSAESTHRRCGFF
jgi:hypothetical protein